MSIHPASSTRKLFYRGILAILSCTIFLGIIQNHAVAQSASANAGISGTLSRLIVELSDLSSPACAHSRCETSLPSIPFTIRIPGYSGGAQVTLSYAKVLNNVARSSSSPERDNSRPILLRGKARLRHLTNPTGRTAWTSITAVLYRRGSASVLEFSLPYRRGSQTEASGLTLVRSAAINNPIGYVRNAFMSRTATTALANRTCRATGLTSNPSASLALVNAASTHTVRSYATYKVVYLATDFDPLFSDSLGCLSDTDCHDRILAIVHHAALFYEAQLGMTLEVARQYGPTATYTSSTDSAALLDDFSTHNAANRSTVLHDGINSGDNLVDVFALYTGRNVDDNVIGLAYLGLGCINSDAAGAALLVQDVSRSFNPVVTAHELGHVFNATHTDRGIMQASLSDPLPSSFSTLSVSQIANHRSQFYGECRQGTSAGISNNLDQPLTLGVKKSTGGKMTITTSTTELQAGCSVFIRAGQSAAETSTGTLIKKFTPQSLSTSISGTVTSRIKSSTSAGSKVFVRAFYKCPDGYLYARSPVLSFNANSLAARRGSAVTRSAWIKAFDRAFP